MDDNYTSEQFEKAFRDSSFIFAGNVELENKEKSCILSRVHWLHDLKVSPDTGILLNQKTSKVYLQEFGEWVLRYRLDDLVKPVTIINTKGRYSDKIATYAAYKKNHEVACIYSYLVEDTLNNRSLINEAIEAADENYKSHINERKEALHQKTKNTPREVQFGHEDATAELIKKRWPHLSAITNSDGREKTIKAYLIDYVAQHGTPPETENLSYLSDRDFINALNNSYNKTKKTFYPIQLELVVNWISQGYYKMSDKDLEAILSQKLNKEVRNIRKIAERLGLTFERSTGPRPVPEEK